MSAALTALEVLLALLGSWIGFAAIALPGLWFLNRRQERAALAAELRLPAAVVHELEPHRAARARAAARADLRSRA